MNTMSHPGVIQFHGYRLTDVLYKCDESFDFPEGQLSYRFNFEKKVAMPTEYEMRVKLRTNVFWSMDGNIENSQYRISVEIAGLFTSNEAILPKWEVNALAILFPYLRSIVSMISSQSGREPVLLPTVNIAEMFAQAENEKDKN